MTDPQQKWSPSDVDTMCGVLALEGASGNTIEAVRAALVAGACHEVERLIRERNDVLKALEAEQTDLRTARAEVATLTAQVAAMRGEVAELRKVEAAAHAHLVAMGPCESIYDDDDDEGPGTEYHCGNAECTYCELNRVASAVCEVIGGVARWSHRDRLDR